MDSSPEGSSRKRKQPAEKASGAAWGAQSFSAAKSSAINKAMKDSGKDPGFGDFGRYFSEKQRKLRDQFHEDASISFIRDIPTGTVAPHVGPKANNKVSENSYSGQVNKDLFNGVSIFVDGFTTPSHQELRFIMMNHGGVFHNYFSSQRVTHIICSTLPDSKIMNPRLMSRGLPIVKPEWIVDSMTANKLLSWDTYQLERIVYSHPHQKTLSAAYAANKLEGTSPAKAANLIAPIPAYMEERDPVKVSDEMVPLRTDTVCPDTDLWTKSVKLEAARSLEDALLQDLPPTVFPASRWQEQDVTAVDLDSGSHREIKQNEELPEMKGLGNQAGRKIFDQRGHSTLNDPNFVQSYFKYSRLHFIGTWRTRYQSLVDAGSFGKPEQGLYTDHKLSGASSSGAPVIIHLDMDCFFVSVVVRNRPGLAGKPVAVCHSESAQGTGEISSANYPARAYGVRAGMFVRDAKACCPDLTIVPYDFTGYEQVADKVYSILHHHCSTVQAVSCDEAFLDVTGHPDPTSLASKIREEIFQSTQCTASAGIAENLLLARLATKKAKPNGQHFIQPHQVKEFIAALPVDQLPGVGWSLREKLHAHGLYNCADLQSISKEVLQKDYGAKTGVMLWLYSQGIDEREVQPAQERKSIGAEVNWGVRFSCMDDAQQFLVTLSNEVALRLQKAASCGRTITLKVKRRKDGAGEPHKFMGCGLCDNLSRSETVGSATDNAEVLLRISRQLFASLHLDVQEVRGVGLQISRLEPINAGPRKQYLPLNSWLAASTSKLSSGQDEIKQITENIQPGHGAEPVENFVGNGAGPFAPPMEKKGVEEGVQKRELGKSDLQVPVLSGRQAGSDVHLQWQTNGESKRKPKSCSLELPPLSQLDHSVLEFLPEDIVAEINDAERAREVQKQIDFVDRKGEIQPRMTTAGQRPTGGPLHSRRSRSRIKPRNTLLALPPKSQLDPSVLESLPEDILAEINHAYGQEQMSSRTQSTNPYPNLQKVPLAETVMQNENTPPPGPIKGDHARGSNDSVEPSEKISRNLESTAEDALQVGVHLRQMSPFTGMDYYALLENLMQQIARTPGHSLSSSLLSLRSYLSIHDGRDINDLESLVQHCLTLLINHIELIASKNLEELQLILLYTKRLGNRCKLWSALQELLLPAVQVVVGELYGGKLTLE